MKSTIIVLFSLFLISLLSAQSASTFDEAMALAKSAHGKGEFEIALSNYWVAMSYNPSKRIEIQKEISGVFDGIKKQRDKAVGLNKKLESQKEKLEIQKKELQSQKEQAEKQLKALKVAMSLHDNFSQSVKAANIHQFFIEIGQKHFAAGDYADAFAYFTSADSLNTTRETMEWKAYAQKGMKANENFYAGYLDEAQQQYNEILGFFHQDSSFIATQVGLAMQASQIYETATTEKNIDTLKLSARGLYTIPAKVGKQYSLRWLDLSFNWLKHIPSEVSNLGSLRWLDVSHNHIEFFPDLFPYESRLEYLDISSNQLKNIPERIWYLQQLRGLDLGSNQIRHLPKYFGHLPRLKELSLKSNQLSHLPASFWRLQQLKELNLSSNLIEHLPDSLAQLQGLKKLNLLSNQLKTMPEGI